MRKLMRGLGLLDPPMLLLIWLVIMKYAEEALLSWGLKDLRLHLRQEVELDFFGFVINLVFVLGWFFTNLLLI